MTRRSTAKPRRAVGPRGAFRSLKSSNGFRDYVLDQLAGIRHVRARPMFGGIGLYDTDTFFGLIAGDVLYFKTNDTNRDGYEKAGCVPFRPYPGRPASTTYFSVPVSVLESGPVLTQWARASIAIAAATPKKKPRAR